MDSYQNRKILIIGSLTIASAFAIGVIIGYFSKSSSVHSRYSEDRLQTQKHFLHEAMEDVSADSVRSYLQELSKEPHLAGLKRDQQLTDWIKEEWIKAGLDHVELATYDFYLSFPNQTNPNKVRLLDAAGKISFTSKHQEDEVRKGDAHPDFVHAFNAYAPSAEVEGVLVYVNYGTVEDMRHLESVGVSLQGKIAIARYGKVYRGNKLENCHAAGAIGLILFSDPADVAPGGVAAEDVYPNSIFLPPSGIQRGSVSLENGDPLSPFWPSVPNAYRIGREENEILPRIPSQPISYEDAKELLKKMGGMSSPAAWKGQINGVEYRIGGEMLPAFQGWKVRLSVNNYEKDVKSSNVIGYLVGDIEPDRYVYMSNHRDAWGYGAIDPSSGTANLMELVRILGKMKKAGWRPRRTIVFCSWATEEHGLLGSEEWVQDKVDKIMARSVGLLNFDYCVSGPIPELQSSPTLREVLLNAIKEVPDWDGRGSVYDAWRKWHNQDRSEQNATDPVIGLLNSGSDLTDFIFYAGVPSIELYFTVDSKRDKVMDYPAYHTGYETFYLVDKLVDPGFKIHKACTQISLHILFSLSESLVVPYNVQLLSQDMKTAMDDMRSGSVQIALSKHGVTLDHVAEAIKEFCAATEEFARFLDTLNAESDPILLKMTNDQLIQLERVFILPQGLPGGRVKNRHALFSPARFNSYGGSAFPGVTDLLHDIDRLEGDALRRRREELKRHVSDLMIVVRNAASFLKPFHKI